MSLIGFHRFLISAGIIFCAGYSGYELVAFARSGSTGALFLGVVFAALALALGGYLWRLNRFLGLEAKEEPER